MSGEGMTSSSAKGEQAMSMLVLTDVEPSEVLLNIGEPRTKRIAGVIGSSNAVASQAPKEHNADHGHQGVEPKRAN